MDAHVYLPQTAFESPQPQESDSLALDHLLHSKSRILSSKLEVLASEIYARLTMWNRNLTRIDDDKAKVEDLLSQFTRLARYHLREQQDVGRLRDSTLQLEAQRRDQDVQCWRDVVLVMRDFLETWEAHEQAKNRSIFLNHAGSRPEESL
jgi:hypothetical protein